MAEAKQLKVYVVRNAVAVTPRLVRAKSRHQALAHVVKDDLSVELADQDALIDLLGNGVLVEIANEVPEGQESLPLNGE